MAVGLSVSCSDGDAQRKQCWKLRNEIPRMRKQVRELVSDIEILKQLEQSRNKNQELFQKADRKLVNQELRLYSQQHRLKNAKIFVGREVERTATNIDRVKFKVIGLGEERHGLKFMSELINRGDRWYVIDRYRQKVSPVDGIEHTFEGYYYCRKDPVSPTPLPGTENLPLEWPLPLCDVNEIEKPLGLLSEGHAALQSFVRQAEAAVKAREQFNLERATAFAEVRQLVEFRKEFVEHLLHSVRNGNLLLADMQFVKEGAKLLIAGMGKGRDKWAARMQRQYNLTPKQARGDAQTYLLHKK